MEHNAAYKYEKWNDETSRLSYFRWIECELHKKRNCLLPNASEKRSYEEALCHLVRLFSDDKDIHSVVPFREIRDTELRCGMKACSTKSKLCCKKGLEEVLRALQSIQRKRSYDPPTNNEIRYYVLIKKYIRSMLAFLSAGRSTYNEISGTYDCFTYSRTLHNVDELVELNIHLADFATFMSEMDIRNSSVIKPLMGIQDSYEASPINRGSKERSYMYYWHKFKLAYHDIRSSEHAYLPPCREEKISYVKAWHHVSSLSYVKDEEKPNVYSEEVYVTFLEMVEREIRDLERHCIRIRKSILEKLSMNEPWESLVESYDNNVNDHPIEDDDDLIELGRLLAMKFRVSKDDLPNLIACVSRCREIARHLMSLLSMCASECVDLCIPTLSDDANVLTEYGWDALHALTIFKCGNFSPGNVFQEHIILNNPEKDGTRKRKREREEENVNEEEGCQEENVNEEDGRDEENMNEEDGCDEENVNEEEEEGCEGENVNKAVEGKGKQNLNEAGEEAGCEEENMKILQGIVEDLRRIEDSVARAGIEEDTLLYKIWLNVASSVHFFYCAMAYEQQRYIVSRDYLAEDGEIVGNTKRKMMKKKNSTKLANVTESRDHSSNKATLVSELAYRVKDDIYILWAILYAYEQGLSETL